MCLDGWLYRSRSSTGTGTGISERVKGPKRDRKKMHLLQLYNNTRRGEKWEKCRVMNIPLQV